jgi:hypothetical protein
MALTSRKKSPRAPSMALDEAIEKAQKAYAKERLHPVPTEVVVEHLGYKSANSGSALAALASLRYYGLLDRPKPGLFAVANDFEHFKFAADERQRQALLLGFLKKPQLYAELLEKYETGLPADANLRLELIQRGFSASAAEGVLAAFRRSVNFVDQSAGNAAPPALATPLMKGRAPAAAAVPNPPALAEVVTAIQPGAMGSATLMAPSDIDQIPVRLPGGRRAWLVVPTPLFASDKDRLKAQIDLLLTQDEEAGR